MSESGALSGLRVLDLSRVLAGPWSAQTLGDLGAEVIKVERPGGGDDTRSWGPPYLRDEDGEETSESAYFLCANRNKSSIAVDFTRPDGQALIHQLASKCDVLIENFKVDGLRPYKLDYESMRAVNPRLIYCSITGFGQTGPYAKRPGYDFLIQAMGGLMSVTGPADGEEGAGPQKVGVALTDIVTGLYATIGILAALRRRESTGLGQHVDMALLDCQVAALANQNANYLTTGVAPRRLGNAHPNIVPYQDFPTADGAMIVAVGNDVQFTQFCRALGRPALADDARFATNRVRVENRAVLTPLLRAATLAKTTNEWIAVLERASVPCGPVNTIGDVFADAQVQARGLKMEMAHPLAGTVPLVRNPIRLSGDPIQYRRPPPLLGEHTRTVLSQWLGLDEGALTSLSARGVIQ